MWGKTILNSWWPNFHLGDDPLFPHSHSFIYSFRWKRRRIEGTNNGQALVFPWFNIFSSQKLLQQHHGAKMKSSKTTHVAEIRKGRPNTPPPTTSLSSSSSSSRIPITISRIHSTTIWLPSSARQGLETIVIKYIDRTSCVFQIQVLLLLFLKVRRIGCFWMCGLYPFFQKSKVVKNVIAGNKFWYSDVFLICNVLLFLFLKVFLSYFVIFAQVMVLLSNKAIISKDPW